MLEIYFHVFKTHEMLYVLALHGSKIQTQQTHPLERKLRARQTLHFFAKLLAGNRAKANKDRDWLRCYNVEVGREEFGSLIFLSFIMGKKKKNNNR